MKEISRTPALEDIRNKTTRSDTDIDDEVLNGLAEDERLDSESIHIA